MKSGRFSRLGYSKELAEAGDNERKSEPAETLAQRFLGSVSFTPGFSPVVVPTIEKKKPFQRFPQRENETVRE
jgi:hypothetical protein